MGSFNNRVLLREALANKDLSTSNELFTKFGPHTKNERDDLKRKLGFDHETLEINTELYKKAQQFIETLGQSTNPVFIGQTSVLRADFDEPQFYDWFVRMDNPLVIHRVIAALEPSGVISGATMVFDKDPFEETDDGMTTAMFKLWINEHLLPNLKENSTILTDNAFYKQDFEAIMCNTGHKVVRIPPYFYELNLFNYTFPLMKENMRFEWQKQNTINLNPSGIVKKAELHLNKICAEDLQSQWDYLKENKTRLMAIIEVNASPMTIKEEGIV